MLFSRNRLIWRSQYCVGKWKWNSASFDPAVSQNIWFELTQNGESKGDTFVWRFMFHLHNNVFSQFYFMEQHLILFRAMITQICSLWYQNHTINWEGNKKNSKYFHEDLYTFLCILRLFFIKIFHSVAIKGYLKSLSYNFFSHLSEK